MYRWFSTFLVLITVFFTGGGALAGGCVKRCESGTSVAGDVWREVEAAIKLTVSLDAREVMSKEFCDAAKDLRRTRQLTCEAVMKGASSVLIAYLQRVVDAEKDGRTIGATLALEFDAPGFSRPELKRYGKLRIRTARPMDAISIRDRTHDVGRLFLVVPGPARVSGLWKARVVCTQQLEISPNATQIFDCVAKE